MPGIAGIIGPGDREVRGLALDRMVRSMLHESFYSSGNHCNEKLGVGVGWALHQGAFADCNPVWNEAKDVCLVFTGENYAEPGELTDLRVRGHQFERDNASSVVHWYEERGIKFLESLNGLFAGVLLDLRQDRIILFNDRYGLSRIYVHEAADCVYFSSEAKSLLRVLPGLRKLDPVGLAQFAACGCALQNRTLFSGVSLLPPASAWIFSAGRLVRKKTYFEKGTWESQPTLNETEFYEKLKETFTSILPKYFAGRPKIGVSLTGGLDGRMIMAWAGHPPGSLPCYTFGGTYRDCTDVTFARRVAKHCGHPHQVLTIDAKFLDQFPALAEKAVYVSDGAMDVTGAVELFANRLAREIAPVRMTGNYGSEILRNNVAFKAQPLNPALFSPEFVQLGENAAAAYDQEAREHLLSFIAFKQVPWHHHSRLSVEQSQVAMRSPYLDNQLVALAYQMPPDQVFSKTPALRLIAEGNPCLGRIPTDRGLVYRPRPLLTRLQNLYQEFTFRADYAFDYGMPQWLARLDHAFAPLHLERAFLGRHKFYHFRVWYRDRLGEYLREILLDPRTKGRPHLQGRRIEQMVIDHIKGVRNYTTELHQALSMELIHRQLIEQN